MTFGIAVIGCGMAALPHARALNALKPGIAVRGVWARDPQKRAAFCAEHGFPEGTSAEALAEDPNVDGVLILTPPNARREYVEMFAKRGKPVLSEKPLERDVPAGEEIVALCRDWGVKLGVVFQNRFREASMALADLLAEGRLGALRAVRVDVPWWRGQDYYDAPGRGSYARDGGGVLLSQAIHTLDLMLSFTGPVSAVQAISATTGFHRMESEDFVAGGLIFANGAVGSLMATTAAFPGASESIVLECEHGSARLASGTLTVQWQAGGRESRGASATSGGGADPMAFPFDWHRDLIADFVASVQAVHAPAVTGDDALAVQRLIAAIEQSGRTGARVLLD